MKRIRSSEAAAGRVLARALAARCRALRLAAGEAGDGGKPEDLDAVAERVAFEEFLGSGAATGVDLEFFYQDFLAAFAPERKRALGVYYTPEAVVHAQVRLVADVLERRLGCRSAFADERVVVVDPAAGSGAYPLAVAAHAADRSGQSAHSVDRPGQPAHTSAARLRLFEPLVGAASVARARLSAQLGTADGLHVEQRDVLEDPIPLAAPILVCLGNPPYHRQWLPHGSRARRTGGWVRFGSPDGAAPPILSDFFSNVRSTGVHAKNLYNDYVYFWRWAVWATCEQRAGPGIVSFVSAASYLRGPGFAGMREHLRRAFDELWIIDLEGDRLAAQRTHNVFPIRTPVAIAMGVRYADACRTRAATVYYARLTGGQSEKLDALESIQQLTDLPWRIASPEWSAPFVATPSRPYDRWPRLTDLFPWQVSGAQLKRTWPIAPTPQILRERWRRLLELSTPSTRADAFRETRDRSLDSQPTDLRDPTRSLAPIRTLGRDEPPIEPVPYAYRSFDRQWILPDARLGDFMRATLWRSDGPRQLFLTSLLTTIPGPGPVAVATALVPDLDHFRGSFGGRAVIPLWRDAEASQPNVADGLLAWLSHQYGFDVSPERLLAYCYALLGTRAFQARFEDELRTPGPRVPLTTSGALFTRAANAGETLLWLHTFGQRYLPTGEPAGRVPPGATRCLTPVGPAYPRTSGYDADRQLLHVGRGRFGPLGRDAWAFAVSGMRVIPAWLNRRIAPARRASVLDGMLPREWSSALSTELLEVIWVVEATLALEPVLASVLDDVCSGGCLDGPAPGVLGKELVRCGGRQGPRDEIPLPLVTAKCLEARPL